MREVQLGNEAVQYAVERDGKPDLSVQEVRERNRPRPGGFEERRYTLFVDGHRVTAGIELGDETGDREKLKRVARDVAEVVEREEEL